MFFGVTGTASWPHGWLEATAPNSWGPVPLEAWVIAGVGYIVLVAVARSVGSVRIQLGFAKTLGDYDIDSTAVIDIASGAAPALGGMATATAMEPTDS